MSLKKPEASTGRVGKTSPSLPVITLLTDFGNDDYFVGAVKGAILTLNPAAKLVDLTHNVPAHDIESAAFTLLAAYKSFPSRTVHLAVVDPGVGSERRALVLQAGGQLFVGPDNGIFSYICERETDWQAFEITNQKFFAKSPSPTFHGRDLFGPVAALLSTGIDPRKVGPKIEDPIFLKTLTPEIDNRGNVNGRILHLDRFGNCITNITRSELTLDAESRTTLVVKRKTIKRFIHHFAEAETGAVFAIWGSAGFLELATKNGSAAAKLDIRVGDEVLVKCHS